MNRKDIYKAWGRVLTGHIPSLSIEITKECPLQCPGCYAYEDQHLGGLVTLRELADYRGSKLVDGILALVESHKPSMFRWSPAPSDPYRPPGQRCNISRLWFPLTAFSPNTISAANRRPTKGFSLTSRDTK